VKRPHTYLCPTTRRVLWTDEHPRPALAVVNRLGPLKEKALTTILVCDSCAAGIANDDWTHLDAEHGDREAADEAHAGIAGWLEIVGYLTIGDAYSAGYFRCACCGYDEIGGVYAHTA